MRSHPKSYPPLLKGFLIGTMAISGLAGCGGGSGPHTLPSVAGQSVSQSPVQQSVSQNASADSGALTTPVSPSQAQNGRVPEASRYGDKLAVINTLGEVWVRDIGGNAVGPGSKLTGPTLFGGPDDRYALGYSGNSNDIAVVTSSGAFWPRAVTESTVGPGYNFSGSLFGGPDAKYVFNEDLCGSGIFVVTNSGAVWFHNVNFLNRSVDEGKQLAGSSLFGGPNDKYVMYDRAYGRILVVNTMGEVWAHDLHAYSTVSPGIFSTCLGYDAVGSGYKLAGPTLFGAPNDRFVLSSSFDNSLLVINSFGEVWARSVSKYSVGPGVKWNGPGLFGTPYNAKYVVEYYTLAPPR